MEDWNGFLTAFTIDDLLELLPLEFVAVGARAADGASHQVAAVQMVGGGLALRVVRWQVPLADVVAPFLAMRHTRCIHRVHIWNQYTFQFTQISQFFMVHDA